MIKNIKKIPNYIAGKILLAELYETTYGIYNHINNSHPYGPVLFTDSDNFYKDTRYERYLDMYMLKEIYNKLGITFDEFINRPRHEIETIIKRVDNHNKLKQDLLKKSVDDLEDKKIEAY